jgi:hypothetical protein
LRRSTPLLPLTPVGNDLLNVGAAALPVCMGVAVLRYRLYAIDHI